MSPARTRRLARVSLVLVVTAVASMTLYFSATAIAATTEVVNSNGDAGWFQRHTSCSSVASTGSQAFRAGPVGQPPQSEPPSGTGSLSFQVGPNGNSLEEIRNSRFAGLDLSQLAGTEGRLEYWTFVELSPTNISTMDEQAPYVILDIDRDANGVHDDSLIYEPPYNGEVELAEWQRWDARAGRWWSTADQSVGSGALPGDNNVQTLTQYLERFPNAKLINGGGFGGVRIATGCGSPSWDGFVGNADALAIKVSTHDVLFDFEPDLPTPSPSTSSPTPPRTATRTATATSTASATATSTSTSTSSPTGTATSTSTSSPTPTQTVGPEASESRTTFRNFKYTRSGFNKFKGQIRSEDDRCNPRRFITIKKQREGRDKFIGTARTDRVGRFREIRQHARGKYYAIARPRTITENDGDQVDCKKGRSKTIRVRRG